MMKEFTSQGLRLRFVEASPAHASRPWPVLLVHGFASTHAVNWINTGWTETLTGAGYRVITLDNRGHGQSDKPHDPDAYWPQRMADDAMALLDHLGIPQAHLMGYSMGARICAFAALAHPARTRSLVLGGLGYHLVDKGGLPDTIADALRAPSLDDVTDPTGRLFRRFAEANGSDLEALAACIVGSRTALTIDQVAQIVAPVLVAVGDRDPIAGDPHRLAALFPHGRALDIPGRDHNLSVGDKVFKAGVLSFLAAADRQAGSG